MSVSEGYAVKGHAGNKFNLSSVDRQIIVLIVPEHNYINRMVSVVRDISNFEGRTCYVSLNRPYKTLIESFETEEINLDKFHFIDGITLTAITCNSDDKCTYVSSPGALTELSLAISKVLEKGER